MKLLLDLGNTRLKWAVHDGAGWQAQGALGWHEDIASRLPAGWHGLAAPHLVLGASVVDAEREALVAAVVSSRFGIAPQWVRTPEQAGGVRNAYPEPGRLGVDRFLAMLAAHADGLAPCVLVSVGTAITLDALTADGRHLGGLIAPGPQLMQQSLLGATSRVQVEHPGRVLDAADNTPDAVASGCWQAAAALIERFHARMTPALGGAPRLLLGGGDAEPLLPLLAMPVEGFADAVLRGLLAWPGPHDDERRV